MRATIRLGLALALLLAAASSGSAGEYGYVVSYYYYPYTPQPVYFPGCVPAYVPVAVGPSNLAVPRAAPPSTSPPPLAASGKGKPNTPPSVSETRSTPLGTAPKKPPVDDVPASRLRAGFWNVSGKTLVITVDGTKLTLPPNRSITVPVNRDFTWQVGDRPPVKERVPENRLVHEIILRD